MTPPCLSGRGTFARAFSKATFRVCEKLGHFNIPSIAILEDDIRSMVRGI